MADNAPTPKMNLRPAAPSLQGRAPEVQAGSETGIMLERLEAVVHTVEILTERAGRHFDLMFGPIPQPIPNKIEGPVKLRSMMSAIGELETAVDRLRTQVNRDTNG